MAGVITERDMLVSIQDRIREIENTPEYVALDKERAELVKKRNELVKKLMPQGQTNFIEGAYMFKLIKNRTVSLEAIRDIDPQLFSQIIEGHLDEIKLNKTDAERILKKLIPDEEKRKAILEDVSKDSSTRVEAKIKE